MSTFIPGLTDLESVTLTANGSITSANVQCTATSCVWIVVPTDYQAVTVQLSGGFSATLQLELSWDGKVWSPAQAVTGETSASGNGTWNVNLNRAPSFRVRASSYSSGPVLVNIAARIQGFFGPEVPFMSVWTGDQNASGHDLQGAHAIYTQQLNVNSPSGSIRWRFDAENTETGSGNTGSDLVLTSYKDNQSLLGYPLSINRATGIVNFSVMPTVNGLPIAGSQTPWTSDIDAAGHRLLNTGKGNLLGGGAGPITAPASSDANIRLYDAGGGNWAGIGADSFGAMWFRTGLSGSPNPALVINTPGNVGIHETNPRYPLSVGGDVNITGVFRINDVALPTTVAGFQSPWQSDIDAAGHTLVNAYQLRTKSNASDALHLECNSNVSTGGAVFQSFSDVRGRVGYFGFGGVAGRLDISNEAGGAVWINAAGGLDVQGDINTSGTLHINGVALPATLAGFQTPLVVNVDAAKHQITGLANLQVIAGTYYGSVASSQWLIYTLVDSQPTEGRLFFRDMVNGRMTMALTPGAAGQSLVAMDGSAVILGSVGIGGIVSPQVPLDVQGAVHGSAFQAATGSDWIQMYIQQPGIADIAASTDLLQIFNSIGTGLALNGGTAQLEGQSGVQLQANGVTRLSLDATGVIYLNGKAGINNSNPAYALDVAGDINTTGAYRLNGAIWNPQTPWKQDIDAAQFNLRNLGAIVGGAQVVGNVNITGAYMVNGIALPTSLAGFQSPWVGDVDGGGHKLTNVGSVGIGVTNPQYMFEVAGSIKANTIVYQAELYCNGLTAPTAARVWYSIGGLVRFGVHLDTSAETGSNAGSNFAFYRYSDSGALLGPALVITRATGVISLPSLPTTNPGAGSKALWYDPADGNRVKYAV